MWMMMSPHFPQLLLHLHRRGLSLSNFVHCIANCLIMLMIHDWDGKIHIRRGLASHVSTGGPCLISILRPEKNRVKQNRTA